MPPEQTDQEADLKSRRPANTAFKQQRLKAWQPILTPKTVLPTFFIVGVLFAPIGGVLLYQSDSVSEIVLDYTNCPDSPTPVPMPESSYSIAFPGSTTLQDNQKPRYRLDTATKLCQIQFPVLQDMKPPLFLYYRLTNFYQNHRRYVKSTSLEQLDGQNVPVGPKLDPCKPLNVRNDGQGVSRPIYPCGLIANSLFNDTIQLALSGTLASSTDNTARPAGASVNYTFVDRNIAWPSDKQKFKASGYIDLSSIMPPPNWDAKYPNGYTTANPPPDLSQDEHFMVWMRTAGLPDFRKLYARNDNTVLKAGMYIATVQSNYLVTNYGGTKSLVISNVSFLGGKNPFLGIVYITVGILCVILGCAFTVTHLWRPRKLGDHTYLSWNQQTGATATGGVGDGTGVTE